MTTLAADHERAVAVVAAIRAGDVVTLRRLLTDHPDLATAQIVDVGDGAVARTLLHVATDWPGHRPNGPDVVRLLVAAGADPNARFAGEHAETPLHWAASNDDVGVIDVLLELGADIDADGAVIAGGTPLTDATAFGQWAAAHRLVERGAHVGSWEAAVMGLDERLEQCLAEDPPGPEDLDGLFWGACHGGRRSTAERLRARGADVNRVGWDDLTPLGAAERSGHGEVVTWLRGIGCR